VLFASIVWVGLFACAPSFPVSRERLGPLRIVGVGAPDGVLRAAVWSGEGTLHAEAPTLRWWVDGAAAGTGWEVPAPEPGAEVRLEVETAGGARREAVWAVAAAPAAFSLARASVAAGEDLSLGARRGWSEAAVADGPAAGEALRLRAVAESGDAPPLRVRWRVEDGGGTLLALEDDATDLLPEAVVFDDGEVVSRDALALPVTPLVQAIAVDGAGGNRWLWAHAPFRDGAPAPLARVGELRLPFDAPAPGLWAVTLEGVTAAGVAAFTGAAPVTTLDAQDPLDCAPADVPFDLAWAIEGRCGADSLDGRRVVLEVR
jgi:hypothetical protein